MMKVNKNEIQNKLKQMEREMEALRKKLDEPELYRGWEPAEDEVYYYADNTGYVDEGYSNNLIETKRDKDRCILGIFPTKAEAQASYDRHMAGEECKKIISKWIAKLEPGWNPDWGNARSEKCFIYLHNGCLEVDSNNQCRFYQDEWYFPIKVSEQEKFQEEIEPHFRKWLGVE